MKLDVIIEISKGSNIKYEFDQTTKRIKVDRILYGANFYPLNYGFIENTIDFDGDPLDVLVYSDNSFNPGVIVPTRIIGAMEMIDDGEVDTKLIGVIDCDPKFNEINNIDDLPSHIKKQIKNFFQTYKLLQKKEVKINNFINKDEAIKIYEETKIVYSQFKNILGDEKKLKEAIAKKYPNKVNL